MDGMAKQGLVSQKAVMLVNAEVIRRIRVERLGEGDLVVVFRQMRLDEEIGVFTGECLACLKLFRRGSDRKTRRNYIIEAALALPARDQRLRIVIAGLCRIAKCGRRVA